MPGAPAAVTRAPSRQAGWTAMVQSRLVARVRATFKARMFTESIAHRDQSNSPQEPSSSTTGRWSLAHTVAVVHSVKRR